jgi:anti-sigma B factor antagonist
MQGAFQPERVLGLLKIAERQVADVTVIDLEGNIIIGAGAVRLHEMVQRLIREGKKKILLNFARVNYVDSSGIGELISSVVTVEREEGQLKLLNISGKTEEVLSACNLFSIFEVYDDEMTAVYEYE